MLVTVTVNSVRHEVEVEPRALLVDLLREHLCLRATNIGCDSTSCGSCTVMLDRRAVKSCTVLAAQADGREVITVEGVSGANGGLHPVQDAFHRCHALQCGFCTPGMVMAAVAFLARSPRPTAEEVRRGLDGNLCRCTGYHNIVRAVLSASRHAAERP